MSMPESINWIRLSMLRQSSRIVTAILLFLLHVALVPPCSIWDDGHVLVVVEKVWVGGGSAAVAECGKIEFRV